MYRHRDSYIESTSPSDAQTAARQHRRSYVGPITRSASHSSAREHRHSYVEPITRSNSVSSAHQHRRSMIDANRRHSIIESTSQSNRHSSSTKSPSKSSTSQDAALAAFTKMSNMSVNQLTPRNRQKLLRQLIEQSIPDDTIATPSTPRPIQVSRSPHPRRLKSILRNAPNKHTKPPVPRAPKEVRIMTKPSIHEFEPDPLDVADRQRHYRDIRLHIDENRRRQAMEMAMARMFPTMSESDDEVVFRGRKGAGVRSNEHRWERRSTGALDLAVAPGDSSSTPAHPENSRGSTPPSILTPIPLRPSSTKVAHIHHHTHHHRVPPFTGTPQESARDWLNAFKRAYAVKSDGTKMTPSEWLLKFEQKLEGEAAEWARSEQYIQALFRAAREGRAKEGMEESMWKVFSFRYKQQKKVRFAGVVSRV